ncbi:Mut7-C RNAse domain-containing protein [Desulfothermus naphthae]
MIQQNSSLDAIYITFIGWLKHILRCKKRYVLDCNDNAKKIIYPLNRRASIKDIIESLGIPHTEIGLIEVNNQKVNFSHLPKKQTHFKIYPHKIPIERNNYLFNEPIKEFRFLVDANVGKLAKFLRMLGFDCFFDWKISDEEIAEIAFFEKRIVLSKDIQLLKRKKILWGKLIQANSAIDQLKETITFFGLNINTRAFTRCLVCNNKLIPVDKRAIMDRLEPKTKKYYNQFSLCPVCDKVYWSGSHVEKMKELLKSLGLSLNNEFISY